MTDEGKNPEPQPVPQQEAGETEQTFSKDYVQELREEAKNYRLQLRELKQKVDAQAQKELEEAGKWEQIAKEREAQLQELQSVREQYDQVLTATEQSNKDRVARIPETMRGLVPTSLSPLELSNWLTSNESILMRPAPAITSATAGNGDRPTGSVTLSEEQRSMARRLGVSEEEYRKRIER